MLHTATDFGLSWVLNINPFVDVFIPIFVFGLFIFTIVKASSFPNRGHWSFWIGTVFVTLGVYFWALFHTIFLVVVVEAFNLSTLGVDTLETFPIIIGIVLWVIALFARPKRVAYVPQHAKVDTDEVSSEQVESIK